MKTIKIIDLKKRTIYVDDIEQIYCDDNYIPERYNIQTTYGTYLVDKEDYFKVKDYLLSLNDEVEIIEEDKKIENKKIEKLKCMNSRDYLENRDECLSTKDIALDIETLRQWINEIIDYLEENK